MYTRPSHRPRDPADVIEVMRRNMFATLISVSPAEGILVSHLPFVYEPERGEQGTLFAHMARANPHGHALGLGELVVFTGPHAYVSPSWYADRAVAPTWDYVAVHCHGTAILHSTADAERNIERLLSVVEAGRWSLTELERDDVEQMLASIVSFEIPVTRIEGKFKLNQGDQPERIASLIEHLEQQGNDALAVYIRRYNGP
jgi:transcriptional regulator